MVYTCIPKSASSLKQVPYSIVNFGIKFAICGNILCLNMFPSLLRQRKNFDVIDAHSHLFVSTNLCALVRRLGSATLVITNHGLRSQAVPKLFQEIYLRTVGRWALNSADKVITFTEIERHDLVGIGVKPEKIVVIPNGIDTEFFHPAETRAQNESLTAIWVGRLCAGKGLKYAILGFEKYVREQRKARIFIVGEGPYYADAAAYVNKNHLEKNILFTGRVENDEIVGYYHRADVYLMTSMSEGMPRTLLEAMACGLPVICTDIQQLIPIVEGRGIVIQKKNVDDVQQSLESLHKNVISLTTLGGSAREYVLAHHSLLTMSQDTLKVYSKIMGCEK